MFIYNKKSNLTWENQMFCHTSSLYSTKGSYHSRYFGEDTYLSEEEITSLLDIWEEQGWIKWTFQSIKSKSFFHFTQAGELRRMLLIKKA